MPRSDSQALPEAGREGVGAPEWRRARASAWTPAFGALLVVGTIQLASGAVFAATVRHEVFDEPAYAQDLESYRKEGPTLQALRSQTSASGPAAVLLGGMAGRLSPGDVRAGRIPVVLAWVGAFALALFLCARLTDARWAWSLTLLMAFPHVPTSIGSFLTEGPTMAFVLAGTVASVLGIPRRSSLAALLAGLAAGAAMLTRQYALAFALGVTASWLLATRSILLASMACVGPVLATLALLLIWGGLLSPSFQAPGGPELQTSVGLNLWRPISAAVYVGVYLGPVVLLARSTWNGRAAVAASVAAAACALLHLPILGNGPVLTMVSTARLAPAQLVFGGFIVAIALYCVLMAAAAVARQGLVGVVRDPSLLLALGTTGAFVVQQFAVGGSNPFYERYVLLVSPFVAYWGLRAAAPSTGRLVAVAAVLTAVGQAMLWRHA